MKQKNIILMVVAVGCGLVAALLTSQMSAKPKTETVDVIVAQKDLPVGTMITKEDLPKVVKFKKMSKEALPPLLVVAEEELVGKRLARAVRVDETFNPQDLKTGSTVTLPKGMDMTSVSVNLQSAVAGFVTPGSRVDILATVTTGNRMVSFPLLVDMLVLAVDQATELPKETGTFGALNTVSFAVDRKQALLLQLARTRGCNMSLVLRNTDREKDVETWKPENVLQLLQNPDRREGDGISEGSSPDRGNREDGGVEDNKRPKATKPAETVMLPIAMVDLPAGTELTVDVIKEKFVVKEVPAPAPVNAVTNLDSIQGKVLQNALVADQWLPKSFVGDYAPGKDVPKDSYIPRPKPSVEAEAPKPESGPARKTHDIVVATGSGHKTFRYQEKSAGSGEWALVGEVNKDAVGVSPLSPEPKPESMKEPVPEPISPKQQD